MAAETDWSKLVSSYVIHITTVGNPDTGLILGAGGQRSVLETDDRNDSEEHDHCDVGGRGLSVSEYTSSLKRRHR